MRCIILAAALLIAPVDVAHAADTVILKGGGKLDCTVVVDSTKEVTAIYKSTLLTFDRSLVEAVSKEKERPAACVATTRLPTWACAVTCAASKPWGGSLKQIAATVVKVGTLAFVPYKSQASGDYEVNVYGDPDAPSGIEVGVYGAGASDSKAQDACIDFIAGLLVSNADVSAVRGLPRDGGTVKVDGMTFEVTPPTAKDAFGGWWISVYSDEGVAKARATADELKAITTRKADARKEREDAKAKVGQAPETKPASGREREQSTDNVKKDDKDDIDVYVRLGSGYADSRRSRDDRSEPSASSASVYVSGYTRKDGTYVRGHYRRR